LFQIKADQISKIYHSQKLFEGFSYDFVSPNIYGISGFNGSGKSTLLKILSGYVTPSDGSITYLRDHVHINVEQIYSHISFAAPYIELITDGTVIEAVQFHFNVKKRLKNMSNQGILDELEIASKAKVKELSSGMMQRLKLALALCTDTEVLFIDEPTETLDTKWQQWYYQKIEETRANRLIFVSSNKEADFENCHKVINILEYK